MKTVQLKIVYTSNKDIYKLWSLCAFNSKKLFYELEGGHVLAQVVIHQPVITEAWIQSQASPYAGQSGPGTGFSSFFTYYHFATAR
jgi:hypothetical protein